jgi:regulatory protein
MKPQRSLKGRALQWLAQREQSRSELRRKLLPHAVAEAEAADEAAGAHSPAAELTPAARVDALLDWLAAHNFLSHERFVESRVQARASRFGNLRIWQELKQHQLDLSAEAAQALKESELQRACAVLERKFAAPPSNAAERAKQARFLAGRGFSPEAIARALRRDGAEQHATFEG